MGKKNLKKILQMGIIIIMFFGASIPIQARHNTQNIQNISFDGTTLYVGGTGPNNYTTIQDAIDNATDGDTVFVYSGTYEINSEAIYISKSINLIGENRESTILKIDYDFYSVYICKSNIVFSGFTVICHSFQGLKILDGENIVISNNIIQGHNSAIAIGENCNGNIIITDNELSAISEVIRVKDNLFELNIIIENNLIDGGYWGIRSWSGKNTITNNTIINILNSGIFLYGDNDFSISGNTIINNKMGIKLENCFNGNITKNNIYDNKINAFQYTKLFSLIKESKVIWSENYWGKAQSFKLIFGIIIFPSGRGSIVPLISIDSNPSQQPI